MNLTPEATAAAEQLALDLGIPVSEAVLRACNLALVMRCLTLDFGGISDSGTRCE